MTKVKEYVYDSYNTQTPFPKNLGEAILMLEEIKMIIPEKYQASAQIDVDAVREMEGYRMSITVFYERGAVNKTDELINTGAEMARTRRRLRV